MSKENMSFLEAIELSRSIYKSFEEIEQKPWTVETILIELMKQVGDLSKRILTYEKYYLEDRENRPEYRTDKNMIGNELADILHQVILIADWYGIDLLKSHIEARISEEEYIKKMRKRLKLKH